MKKRSEKPKRKKCPECGARLGICPTKCYKCNSDLVSYVSVHQDEMSFEGTSRPYRSSKMKVIAVILIVLAIISLFYIVNLISSIMEPGPKEPEIIDEGTGKKNYVKDLLELIKEKAPLDYELVTDYVDTIIIKESLETEEFYFTKVAGLYAGGKTIHLAADSMREEVRDAGIIVHEATHSMVHNLRKTFDYKEPISSSEDEYAAYMREHMFLYTAEYHDSYEEAVNRAVSRWGGRGFSIDPYFDYAEPIYLNDNIEITINRLESVGIYTREWNTYYIQRSGEKEFDYAIQDTIINQSQINFQKTYEYHFGLPTSTNIEEYKPRIPKEFVQDLLGVDSPFMLGMHSTASLPYSQSMLYDDVYCRSKEDVFHYSITLRNLGKHAIHGGMLRVLANNYPLSRTYSHYPVYCNEIKSGESITTSEDLGIMSNQIVIIEFLGLEMDPICINNLFEMIQSQHPNFAPRYNSKMNNKEAEQIWDNVYENFTINKIITSDSYINGIKADEDYLYGIESIGSGYVYRHGEGFSTTVYNNIPVFSKDGGELFKIDTKFQAMASDSDYIYTTKCSSGDTKITLWSKTDGSFISDCIYSQADVTKECPISIENINEIALNGDYMITSVYYKIAIFNDSVIEDYSPMYYFVGEIHKSNLQEMPTIIFNSNHTQDISIPCSKISTDDNNVYYEIENKLYTNVSEAPIMDAPNQYCIEGGLIYMVKQENVESPRPFTIYYISSSTFYGTPIEDLLGSYTELGQICSDGQYIYASYAFYGEKEIVVWEL
ncbi:MAG: hypothetical protein JSW00_05155 [Thermoplasmata archaeon]|nr:MAG: hypothetical protein JSW00_05155 [Thermoplasmata archaeon]